MLGLHPEHETWIVLKKKLTRYKVNFVAQSSNQALVTSRFSSSSNLKMGKYFKEYYRYYSKFVKVQENYLVLRTPQI